MTRAAPRARFVFQSIYKIPACWPCALARVGAVKALRPYYKRVRPRVLKFKKTLPPNWSYKKKEYSLTKLGRLARSVRVDRESNILIFHLVLTLGT